MPREYVTGSCGHQVRFGWARAEALTAKQIGERRADARQRLCWDCYKAQQAAQAARLASQHAFPPLSGTPRQIAWAEALRAQAPADEAELGPEELTAVFESEAVA